MSLFNVFEIAGSALSAQVLRMNVTTSNMANADSATSSAGTTYRARQPVFSAVLDEMGFGRGAALGGVRVEGIVESLAPPRRELQPDSPLADADGWVYYPNVQLMEEVANMMSASRTYQTNLEVVNASKQMLLRTIAMGR